MHGLFFNPFNKDIKDVKAEDLAILREVNEGWYIEYKSMEIESKKIAKSLAAFANHYGGWLFFGIDNSASKTNAASSFPGIPKSSVTSLLNRIRDSARTLINPPPYFEPAVIDGPCSDIGLPESQSIIAIIIPAGLNPPYLNYDGRIYRRVLDSSDPVHEKDRFILDALWQRGKLSRNDLSGKILQSPQEIDLNDRIGYLRVFLLVDPFDSYFIKHGLSFDDFMSIMKAKNDLGIDLAWDNFFMSSDKIICRQVGKNAANRKLLTWEYYHNSNSTVTIPLPIISDHAIIHTHALEGYIYGEQLIAILQKDNTSNYNFIDITALGLIIYYCLSMQKVLLNSSGRKEAVFIKAVLHNSIGYSPYFDSVAYVNFITDCCLPVIQENPILIPFGLEPDTMIQMSGCLPDTNATVREKAEALARESKMFLAALSNAFGLPYKVTMCDEWFDAMIRAANRSKPGK
jgi:hypothetical protein